MTEIVISVQDEEKAKLLIELLQSMDFVVRVQTHARELPVASMNQLDEEPVDFFSLIGIWKDRNISLAQLREQAWPKRT